MKTLIKNGNVVEADRVFRGDILLEGEQIRSISESGSSEKGDTSSVDRVVDATGRYVLAGAIDVHTHMELQQSEQFCSVDDFYSGTVAAALGGTTTIVDHIGFGPAGCPLHHSIDRYHQKGKKSAVDYSFHGVLQHIDDEILTELEDIVRQGGIPSFKGYTTYGFKMEDDDLYRIMLTMKKAGGLLTVHAENDRIIAYLRKRFLAEGKTDPIYHALSRPAQTESEAVARLAHISELAGDAPLYIVHLSTKEGLRAIKDARARGLKNIHAETCPQYLMLTENNYNQEADQGLKYIMAPPLRCEEDQKALWKALENGEIQVVATDHCPFMLAEKMVGKGDFTKAPGGAAGVEERVAILFSEGVKKGRISLVTFVKLISTQPAELFGMGHCKGRLLPGYDGDVMILNDKQSKVLSAKTGHSRCDYSIYEGMRVDCSIDEVFLRGKHIVSQGQFLGERGEGRFVHRLPRK